MQFLACPGFVLCSCRRIVNRILLTTAILLAIAGPLAAQQFVPLTWTQQNPANSPSSRAGAAVAYDSAHGKIVLFGGLTSGTVVRDTWTWDGSNWSQQSPTNNPPARTSAVMTYDGKTGEVVLFGGDDANGNALNDTWTWNGSNWTQQNPASSPPARSFASMTYDASHQQVVLFGGVNLTQLNDTWTWDGSNWTQQNPAHSPGARDAATMAYSAAIGQSVLFGGKTTTNAYLSDTWTWDGTDWTQQSPATSPSGRNEAAMASAGTNGAVLFGGHSVSGLVNDTWIWTGSNWIQQNPAVAPAARASSALAYDSATGTFVLFGGINFGDTWTLTYGPLNLGTANICPAGGSSPSPCSQTGTVTFSYDATESITSITVKALTAGASWLDFTDLGSGTCNSLGSLVPGDTGTCTVNVKFAPRHPGQRLGAVQLLDQNGAVLGTDLLNGAGAGPQVVFPSNLTTNTIGSGFGQPVGVAVDGNGDVLISDANTNVVKEIVAVGGQVSSTSTVNTVASGFSVPIGLAIDGSGDIFVADKNNHAVKEIVAVNGQVSSSSTVSVVNSSFSGPASVALDGNGDVFVADAGNNSVDEIVAVNGQVSSSSAVITAGSGFSGPLGVAVDGNGNVFVADSQNNAVKEIVAVNGQVSSTSAIKTVGSGFTDPVGVALDAASNVFVSDWGNGAVKEILAANAEVSSSSTVITLGSGFSHPRGVAVDASGNVYAADNLSAFVAEIALASPSPLSFVATDAGSGNSSDSPKSVTVANDGNAALTFALPTLAGSYNPSVSSNFAWDNASTCTQTDSSSGTALNLAEGASCTVAIDFAPTIAGSINGSSVLTDDSLNAPPTAYATQTINLSGTGTQPGSYSCGSGYTLKTFTNNASAGTTTGAIQSFVLPSSSVVIDALGAQGGSGANGGGGGAEVVMTASITPGQTLCVLPGVQGGNYGSGGAGGGGGSFVYAISSGTCTSNLSSLGLALSAPNLLVAAGGGGGSGNATRGAGGVAPTGAGTAGAAAGSAGDQSGGNGGVGGNGGGAITNSGGGGGIYTAGTSANGVPGGSALVAGGAGGSGYGSGGFGGGGAATDTGGGGGGFNGGGAGGISPMVGGGGGGGGSYSIATPLTSFTQSGVHSGNGLVSLCYLQQASHFAVSAPSSVTAGSTFQITVTALDASGSLVPGYTGTVHLASTDPAFANATGDATLTNGIGIFTGSLKTAGSQTITAMDTASSSITGTSGAVSVSASTPSAISAITGTPQSSYVDVAFSTPITALVMDVYGNGVSGATVDFTAPPSGASATLSGSGLCTTDVTGRCSVIATANGTTGSYSVTASSPGLSGTAVFALTNNPPPNFVVTTAGDDAGAAVNCSVQPRSGTGTDASCSLRDALLAAAGTGSGNITFDSTKFAIAQTILLSSGTLTIRSNTSISGPTSGSGATLTNLVTVSGNHAFTAFTVSGGVTGVVLANLNITNGSGNSHYFAGGTSNSGGGIFNAGTLTVSNCSFSANTASGSATFGGGIENAGSLKVANSTFSGNSATYGGGIDNNGRLTVTYSTFSGNSATYGGGIENDAGASALMIINSTFSSNSAMDGGGLGTALGRTSVSLVNSTFSGNSATGLGGGISNEDTPTTIVNCTISGNSAPTGGGIENYGSLTLANNILSGNSGGDESGGGSSTDNGGNLIGNSSVQLAPLGNYGGTTQTMIPLPGSAAICAGSSSQVPGGTTTDQRGVAFGAGGYCPSGSVDAGAVQTDYALSFSAQPAPISPATSIVADTDFQTAVTLDENGALFAASSVSIPLTLSGTGTLAGGAATTINGVAAYSNLQVSATGSNDQLAATLPLNTATSPATTISRSSSPFSVGQATTTFTFTPSPASQTYGTAISSASLNAVASYNNTIVPGTTAYTTTVNGTVVTLRAGTTMLPVGSYTLTATFTPTDPAYASTSTAAGYNVIAASVTATVTASSKVYDGTNAGAVSTCNLTGVIAADAGNVTCSANGATFASANVGSSLTVTATGISLSGSAAPNYMLASTVATTTAAITAAPLTIRAADATRLYGVANPDFTGTVTGAQNGDTFAETLTSIATQSSTVGVYTIVPSVTGPNLADYAQSIIKGVLTISQAPSTIALSVSGTSITPGQSVTLTATVASTTTGTPSGTVSFYDNGALLNPTPATLSGGVATYSTATLSAGVMHSITATYSGDVNFAKSLSTAAPATTITVGSLDFTMTLAGPSSLSVLPGHNVSYQVQITPDYGSYAGAVTFAVSGLPPGATATFSPSTVAANSGPQTVTIVISTAASAAINREQPGSGSRRAAPIALAFLLLFGAGTLRKRGRVLGGMLCALVLLGGVTAAAMLSGCGAHAGFFADSPQNYTVTTTATAANLQHSTTITLNVQ